MTLGQVISLIEERFKSRVIGIEYEDGSGKNFNVRLYDYPGWTFVQIVNGQALSRWKSVKRSNYKSKAI
jgi:hypothetical protein